MHRRRSRPRGCDELQVGRRELHCAGSDGASRLRPATNRPAARRNDVRIALAIRWQRPYVGSTRRAPAHGENHNMKFQSGFKRVAAALGAVVVAATAALALAQSPPKAEPRPVTPRGALPEG